MKAFSFIPVDLRIPVKIGSIGRMLTGNILKIHWKGSNTNRSINLFKLFTGPVAETVEHGSKIILDLADKSSKVNII